MRFSVGDYCKIDVEITDEIVARFAEISGDYNPIHIDEAYASRTPTGHRIAHGALLSSYVSQLIGMHLPGTGALWISYSADYKGQVHVGDSVTLTAKVVKVSEAMRILDLEIIGTKPNLETVLIGKAKVMDLEGDSKPVSVEVRHHDTAPLTQKQVAPVQHPIKHQRSNEDVGVALITGGSGVIGQEVAKNLCAKGFKIILMARDPRKLKSVEQNLLAGRVGAVCYALPIDLNDNHLICQSIDEIMKKTGPITAFVHLAHCPVDPTEISQPKFAEQLDQNYKIGVRSFAQIASHLMPVMEGNGGGNIIAMLSQFIYDVPPAGSDAYTASKLMLWSIVKSFAREGGPKNIRTNAISPGMLNTPFSSGIQIRIKQIEEANNPCRRLCQPEDIANLVEFLTSPKSSYINGVNIPLTGGRIMI